VKLYFSIILTLVVGIAQAQCPTEKTTTRLPDGTIKIVRESGVITTISPRYQVDHYLEWRDEEHRAYMLKHCNWNTPTGVVSRYARSIVTTPSGTITGYTTTK